MKKPKTKHQIELEFKDKITKKETQLNNQLERSRQNAEDKIDTKLTNRRNRKLQSYIKLQERNRDRQLKNLERIKQWKKEHTYAEKKEIINKWDVLEVLQLLSKVRDCDSDWMVQCISCPSFLHWWVMHGTHYETRENNAVAFHMDNIHGWCDSCNNSMHLWGIGWAKTKAQYKIWLIKKIWQVKYNELVELSETAYWHTVDIPAERRLQEIYDRAIQEILRYIKKKKLEIRKWSTAYKIMKPYLSLLKTDV